MASSDSHDALALNCGNVWIDPPGHFLPMTVEIAGGCIKAVRDQNPASAAELPHPGIDLGDAYLMPGLINTHVHLEFSAGSNPMRDYCETPVSDRLNCAVRNSQSLLLSGVTTARDCGSSLELLNHFQKIGNQQDLPRLLFSGPPITVPKGHLSMFGGTAASPDGISARVSQSISAGARSLKFIGSGGGMTPGSFPETVAFPQESFCQVADAARAHGVGSAAHVLASESVKRAAKAGFDSLEHCAFFCRSPCGRLERRFDPEIAGIVAESGVSVMPNLSTATRTHGTLSVEGRQGNLSSQHVLDQHEVMLENFGRLADLGIPIVCGTDAGVRDTPFEDTWIELELMARSGLSNTEVIRSASVNAARVLKLNDTVGRIAAGYSADFVVLRNSPLAEISSYRDPVCVFSRGRRRLPIEIAEGR